MATSAKGRLKRPPRSGMSGTLIALASSTILTTCRSQTCSQAVILPLHTHRERSSIYPLLPSVAHCDVKPQHSSTTIPQTTQATPDQPEPVPLILPFSHDQHYSRLSSMASLDRTRAYNSSQIPTSDPTPSAQAIIARSWITSSTTRDFSLPCQPKRNNGVCCDFL